MQLRHFEAFAEVGMRLGLKRDLLRDGRQGFTKECTAWIFMYYRRGQVVGITPHAVETAANHLLRGLTARRDLCMLNQLFVCSAICLQRDLFSRLIWGKKVVVTINPL